MMHGMGDPKPARNMHPAVAPVKPRVMGKQIEEYGKWQIPKWVIIPAFVNPSPAMLLPAPGHNTRWNAIDRCREK